MAAHAITLHLPESLYERFRQRAKWSHRSVETELLEAVASSASTEEGLSAELLAAVEALESLADEDLWHLARKALSPETSRSLEALHLRQRDEGLQRGEEARLAKLVQEYERTMLIRAQAARLLKDRGHDISGLLAAR